MDALTGNLECCHVESKEIIGKGMVDCDNRPPRDGNVKIRKSLSGATRERQ